MLCPRCGSENTGDSIFCKKCGASMAESENINKFNLFGEGIIAKTKEMFTSETNKIKVYSALLIILFLLGGVYFIDCQKESPDVVISNFCTHLQKLEFDQSSKYVFEAPTQDSSPFEDELTRSGFSKMTFKVGETKYDGRNSAEVSVTTSAPNLSEALDLAMNLLYSSRMYLTPDPESLLRAKTYEIINQNQAPIYQTTTIFTLKKEKGNWYIVNDEEFQEFALSIFGY